MQAKAPDRGRRLQPLVRPSLAVNGWSINESSGRSVNARRRICKRLFRRQFGIVRRFQRSVSTAHSIATIAV
jgi:hypothetical protein